MSKVTDSTRPPLNDFLSTLPSPLTVALVGLGPSIYRLRRFLEIVSWKTTWDESWLALGLWWLICLFSGVTLRYALPIVVLAAYVLSRWIPRKQDALPFSATEDTLHRAIADLTTIHSLLPSITFSSGWTTVPLQTLLRTLAILYLPYLILTYFFRLRVLLAIIGTVLLTWRSRWAALIRQALWRSAYIRWFAYSTCERVTGTPIKRHIAPADASKSAVAGLSSKASDSKQSGELEVAQPQPGHTLRFLFTICENQRWWMGLDFTAALLPNERASWCTTTQQPVSPPAAFSLPSATTVYLADPDPARKKEGGRIKRTARWTWEEPEWRVVVRREGTPGVTRVERPLPSLTEEGVGVSANRLLKNVSKMRQASISSDGSSPERVASQEGEAKETTVEAEEEEPFTDQDGWVYGDNKWEGGSAKGGMGKYTRYRRWTRIAVLMETVEHVGPGPLGIHRGTTPISSPTPTEQISMDKAPSLLAKVESDGLPQTPSDEDNSRLRQRLRAAVQNAH